MGAHERCKPPCFGSFTCRGCLRCVCWAFCLPFLLLAPSVPLLGLAVAFEALLLDTASCLKYPPPAPPRVFDALLPAPQSGLPSLLRRLFPLLMPPVPPRVLPPVLELLERLPPPPIESPPPPLPPAPALARMRELPRLADEDDDVCCHRLWICDRSSVRAGFPWRLRDELAAGPPLPPHPVLLASTPPSPALLAGGAAAAGADSAVSSC